MERSSAAPTECLIEADIYMMDVDNFNGKYVKIEPGVRAPNTRSPVHTHPYGGSTCVVQGELTLALGGEEDQTFRGNLASGVVECHPMPAPNDSDQNKMAATNTGKNAALIINLFTVPNGKNPKTFKPMCVLQTGNPASYTTGSDCD